MLQNITQFILGLINILRDNHNFVKALLLIVR